MNNTISFKVWGKQALFTDPITKTGGEKFSYQLPTYEALKGITKSIYWKPTFIWVIDKLRILHPIRMQSKSTKPLNWGGGNTLAIYTYLTDVAYEVEAHFEWNLNFPELEQDRNLGKHQAILQRMLERGGRQDIFLGTRECQAYVEPCRFGTSDGFYDGTDLDFGLMFHSFGYPEEMGIHEFHSHFWHAQMRHGIVEFPKASEFPKKEGEDGSLKTHVLRPMKPEKCFGRGKNVKPVENETLGDS